MAWEYFWVDTCCIDKSNHTEHTEAIYCMFRWYQNAAACYVWFNRGWALEELLAPSQVIFFSSDGQRLGDKKSLQREIRERTNIPVGALEGTSLSTFNVDKRMS
ncbi:unnamed protein product [Clonostachys solani]|uniref:Heterokaryon incompatibility domain-containing protein n=1 Tax=Clonostachys solani TaxID=160281 RepID=A0A9N9ZLH6_9HYPO|nr:unnamed protein product [Clonostachys solani]